MGGCCIIDFEKDGKSSKFMLTLELWTWKKDENLDIPLTYWFKMMITICYM
jgi:hypothetical protein